MNVEIKDRTAAILQAQLAAGNFATIDEAIEAAVLALIDVDDSDLAWAKPHLAVADEQIAAGQTVNEEDAFAELEQLYGKL
jgi:Arc/MetJ-type ribon-helix-helix transcriptional regulator